MWLTLLGLAAAAPGVAAPLDTTLVVERGEALRVLRVESTVRIEGVDGDELSVQAGRRATSRGAVRVRRTRNGITVSPGEGRTPREIRIQVPRWMEVDLEIHDGNLEISGLRAEVNALVNDGIVDASDLQGTIRIQSLDGGIDLTDVEGRIHVEAADDGIEVRRGRGSFELNSVDGHITLIDVEASRVVASTVDGHVRFEGSITGEGRSSLTAHEGNITLALSETPNISVDALAKDGFIETDFPATMQRDGDEFRIRFVLGAGGPELRLQTFEGSIRILER